MRALFWIGSVCALFGLGSYRVLGEFTAFSAINCAVAGLALLALPAVAVRRLRVTASPHAATRSLLRALTTIVATAAISAAAVWAADRSDLRFDWTFEQRFALADATKAACNAAPQPLEMTLYRESGDPRIRNTRMLLEEIARSCKAEVRERDLELSPEDEDQYGIGSSNSVVLRSSEHWELVERPTEGAIFEALTWLSKPQRQRVLYFTVGAGEGDLEGSEARGFSGLRSALEIEGYEARPLPSAVIQEIPADADGVVAISPERPLRASAADALRTYLNSGGTLIILGDPARDHGLGPLLAEFGIRSPDALLVDPDSGPVEGDAPGVNPIAYNYADHPLARGLNRNRQTFFHRARSFELRKPQSSDKLRAVVFASGESWLLPDANLSEAAPLPAAPRGARFDYHPIVVTGRYPREKGEARIVAFGDSDFASNRYLRTLYNLDLIVNAVHWSTRREPAITLRPKVAELIQFPVPLQNSLQALYGIGLIVPQLLLVTAGLMYLRMRSA